MRYDVWCECTLRTLCVYDTRMCAPFMHSNILRVHEWLWMCRARERLICSTIAMRASPFFSPSFFGCCTCTHQKLSSSYLANDEIISICKNVNAASVLRMMHVVKQHQHSIIENWIEWNISSESIWCETVARLFCPFSKFVQIEKRTRRRMESCFHCFSFPSLPND